MDKGVVTSNKRYFLPGLLLFILILLATLPLFTFTPLYLLVSLSNIFMYVILTVSWTLFSGPTRYISLAPAAFFGLGIYASAIFGNSLLLPIVIGIGGLASFILALIVGALTLRLKGIYFAMFTFGLVQLTGSSLRWWEINISNKLGRLVMSIGNTNVYYAMLIILVVLMLTAYFIRRSKFGLALKSIGENEEAAAHIGINVTMMKIITFAISAFFMGAAGVVMATRWTYIDPSIAFNPLFSFLPVLMAIFGGVGHLFGPVLGATIFAYIQESLLTTFPYHAMLIFGIILVVAILYLPHGLMGLVQKLIHTFNEIPQVRKVREGRNRGYENA
jgi:branched-chain amino acid transport system permease protein